MSSPDSIQRILFDEVDVRGVVTGLGDSYQAVLQRNDYPEVIQTLLGEMLAAVTLLSSTLKFEGRLSLQAQGEGSVRLLMAECSYNAQVRAIARVDGELPDTTDFSKLLEQGRLALTLEPAQGQRYQGVVPLEESSLAGCLEAYFRQSEQLPTRLYLAADQERAAGLLLQVMPAAGTGTSDWEHITLLADTLKTDELLQLENEAMLYRLFHQEHCRLFEPSPLAFGCDCSRERCANALRMMEQEDLQQAAVEQGGAIQVSCQFCNTQYRFDPADLQALFTEGGHLGSDAALH